MGRDGSRTTSRPYRPSVAAMRTFAVAVLGLFCGFLTAAVVIEVVARLAVDGRPSSGLIVFFAAAPQVGAVVGVLAAIAIDRMVRRHAAREDA